MEKIRQILGDLSDADMGTHASSIAFFFFTSIIPVLVIVCGIVSRSGVTAQDLVSLAGGVVPEPLTGLVGTLVREAYENLGLALTLSLVALLWTASKGVTALIHGLNAAYGVKESRNRLQIIAVSLLSVVVLVLILAAALFLIFSGGAARLLSTFVPGVIEPDARATLAQTAVLLAVGIAGFALGYTFLPAGRRRMRDQLPGAVLAAIAWLVFSLGFRIYVDYSTSFTILYGSLATVALFLFWMYCVFLILLAGGFFNRHRSDLFGSDKEDAPEPGDTDTCDPVEADAQ
ncbi:MAG: YihY/virulence factor BrkB family protein [Olsenella sp.]|nr:YihY/virulence factor BrkB family protein [Olsenella sp.]